MAKSKRKKKKGREAVPLSEDKVLETIKGLPSPRRVFAQKSYNKFRSGKSPRRHGSELFAKRAIARGKPHLAMTAKERKLAALMYGDGASYRAVEEILGMEPCSGNDAYRQIDRAIMTDKSGKLGKKVAQLCEKSGQPVPEACKLSAAMVSAR